MQIYTKEIGKFYLRKEKNDTIKIVIFDAGLVLEENKKKIAFSKLWYILRGKNIKK